MKKIVALLSAIGLLLTAGCSTVVPLQLDTLRPARVSYHMPHPALAVVCNTPVPDVSDESRYVDAGGKTYRMEFAGDSVPHFFTMSLTTQLHESACFDSITTIFPDSAYLTGPAALPPPAIAAWQEEFPGAVVMSINDVQPVAQFREEALDGIYGVSLVIATHATLQCIVPGTQPVSENVVDTLAWYGYGLSPQLARTDMPPFEICLEEALSSLAALATHRFVPHVQQVERYIFVTSHAAMNDAYKYWQNERYEEASYLWEYVYEGAKDRGRKARAAANLALYHELCDEYSTALTYARAAQTLFADNNDTAEAAYAASYVADLETRITDALLLNTQWGE